MKIIFDRGFSLILLILLSPLLVIISLLVWLFLGRPVLFAQERPGYKGRIFKLYKFRTMLDARASNGSLLDDSDRLTAFGRLLRKTSLDELPELFNIFRGEMSFVGPRPLLPEYLTLYSADQRRRHDVLPGITGLAQINGRNNLNWEERFELDLFYVQNHSFLMDLKILFKTVGTVLRAENVEQSGHATMEKFEGNSEKR